MSKRVSEVCIIPLFVYSLKMKRATAAVHSQRKDSLASFMVWPFAFDIHFFFFYDLRHGGSLFLVRQILAGRTAWTRSRCSIAEPMIAS